MYATPARRLCQGPARSGAHQRRRNGPEGPASLVARLLARLTSPEPAEPGSAKRLGPRYPLETVPPPRRSPGPSRARRHRCSKRPSRVLSLPRG